MASTRQTINKIDFLMDGETRLKDCNSITTHIIDFFRSLYTKEEWDRPTLDNLNFAVIMDDIASWLESEFDEQEVREAVFNASGDKSLGPDGYPMTFFQHFWDILRRTSWPSCESFILGASFQKLLVRLS